MRKACLLFLALFLPCWSVAWGQPETSHSPVDLIDGFKSYQSIEETQRACAQLGHEWVVIEDSRSPKKGTRPRFDILVVEVDGYKHLEQDGVLRLEFFNGRLFKTCFYADDHETYLEALLQTKNVDLMHGDEKMIGDLQIGTYKDYRGKPFIRPVAQLAIARFGPRYGVSFPTRTTRSWGREPWGQLRNRSIVWIDIRLQEEEFDWIKKYS